MSSSAHFALSALIFLAFESRIGMCCKTVLDLDVPRISLYLGSHWQGLGFKGFVFTGCYCRGQTPGLEFTGIWVLTSSCLFLELLGKESLGRLSGSCKHWKIIVQAG